MNRIAIPLFLALAACSTSTNGGAILDLSLEMTSSSVLRAAGLTAVDIDGTALTIDSGTVHLSRIDLEMQPGEVCDPATVAPPVRCEPAEEAGEGDVVRIDGPFLIDLATGSSEPSLEGLSVPAGIYDEIELRLSPDEALAGASIVATGTVADASGASVPWTLGLDIDEDAEFEAVGGIEVRDATAALVRLDVAVWFAELPVGQCLDDGLLAPDGAGGVILDDSAGCELEETLEEAIEESGEVDDDPAGDDDGLDDDDHTENETETETD